MLLGRDVDATDATGVRSCWLGETMRRKFLKDVNPVGHRMVIHYSQGDVPCEIRGVVADARTNSLRGALPPRFYTAFFGAATQPVAAVVMLRVNGDPMTATPDVRRILRETNAAFGNPVFHTIPELIDAGLATDRLTAVLASLFGIVAMLMAAIGLYGVLSYSVTRRVSEIGLRMALGAGRATILRLIVGEAVFVAVLGLGAGLAGAIGGTRLVSSLLFGLSPRDPATLAASLLLLLVVSIAAAARPAWRASRTDPLVALRSE